MNGPRDTLVVELSPAEMEAGRRHAEKKRRRCLERGCEDHLHAVCRSEGEVIQLEALGSQAEIAVAKALGEPWQEDIDRFKLSDCGEDIQVRAAFKEMDPDRNQKCLIFRFDDPKEDRYVFVEAVGNTFYIVGWLFGRECFKRRFVRNPGGRGEACFVPRDELRKPLTLKGGDKHAAT